MSQFCKEMKGTRRCVLFKNHDGECSLQASGSAAVRQIERNEETERKLNEREEA